MKQTHNIQIHSTLFQHNYWKVSVFFLGLVFREALKHECDNVNFVPGNDTTHRKIKKFKSSGLGKSCPCSKLVHTTSYLGYTNPLESESDFAHYPKTGISITLSFFFVVGLKGKDCGRAISKFWVLSPTLVSLPGRTKPSIRIEYKVTQ